MMSNKIKNTTLWERLISSQDTASSKRVITLLMSLHFVISSFVILFIAFFVIFYLPKGKVDENLIGLLKIVLEYDFYIILGGLGFITTENMGSIMNERAKTIANANVAVGSPTADNINVDTVNVSQKNNPKAPDATAADATAAADGDSIKIQKNDD
jgi:hypothetical protein